MSWHCSQALVAEYSAACSSGGELFAPWSETPFAPDDSCSGRTKDTFHRSPFGTMYVPSTDGPGEALLTWFLAASRARTSAPPARAKGLRGSAPASGVRWRELSVRYDPASCTWRTHRSLWDEDLSACSLTLPKWGSMRDGVLWERPTLEHPTKGNDSGVWPTPQAHDCQKGYADRVGRYGTKHGGRNLNDWVAMWPTPTATLGTKGGRVTPRKGREGGTLIEAVSARMFPTPTATNTKANHMRGSDKGKVREPRSYGETGQLNPNWVEWLMGWPIGWTGCEPLATDKFREWLRLHSCF